MEVVVEGAGTVPVAHPRVQSAGGADRRAGGGADRRAGTGAGRAGYGAGGHPGAGIRARSRRYRCCTRTRPLARQQMLLQKRAPSSPPPDRLNREVTNLSDTFQIVAASTSRTTFDGASSSSSSPPSPHKKAVSRDLAALTATATIDVQMGHVADTYFRMTVDVRDRTVDDRGLCVPLAETARASLNGISLVRLKGMYRGASSLTIRDCLLEFGFGPAVGVKLGPGQASTLMGRALPRAAVTSNRAVLRLEDETTQWRWEIADASAQRRISIESPPKGALKRGQTVMLRWSPASDTIGPHITAEMERSPALHRDVPAQWRDNRVSFTVPANLPETFDGPLTIRIHADVMPATGPCPSRVAR